MTLAQMESRFFELKGKLAVGQLAEDEFKREMEKLRFQDQQGRWWMIGAQSGRWYYYDGARWLLGQPPAEEPAPPSSLPERENGDAPRMTPAMTQPADTPFPPPANLPPPPPAAFQAAVPPPPMAARPTVATPPPAKPKPVKAAPPPKTGLPARLKEPSPRGPTLADRVREEMGHVHMPEVHAPHVHIPEVHVPEVHVPEVHAPAPIRRFSPYFILLGAVVVGLVIVALMWLAIDNFVPGKPISSFLGKTLNSSAVSTPTAKATGTPLAGANVDTILKVSDDLVSKSQFASALSAYQDAARQAPNNADVYVHWARALALTGRIQDAADNARRATRIDTNSADAYAELTRDLAWSGQYDEAVKDGEKAIGLDDKNATAHAFLAEAYLRAGRTDDAGKEAARAVQIDDKNADAHRAAGWVAVLAKNQDQGTAEWQRVTTELAPDQFFYHYEFGQVYSSYLNDAPNAILEYQKAIALFAPYVPSYIA
ncbi:MAG: tetratricopeptide repeat protein, partial [Anaerolineae bacterium]